MPTSEKHTIFAPALEQKPSIKSWKRLMMRTDKNSNQLENQPSDAVQQARQEAALPSMQQEEQEGQEARQGLQVLQEGQPVQG